MPLLQRFLPQKLPQPLVQVRRVRRQMLQVEPHPFFLLRLLDPLRQELGMLILGVVQVDAEVLRVRILAHHQREQFDHTLGIEVRVGVAAVEILVVVGAERPEDVQSLAATADTDLEALAYQQPAVEHHFQPIERMDSVHEIAAIAFVVSLLLVLLVFGDELLLLFLIGLEEEGAGLVEGAAQPHQQFAHATDREPSTEGGLDPRTHLGGALETPGGNFLLELVELGSRQSARVALILQRTERIEPLFSVQSDPVVDGARADIEQVGNFLGGIALVQPQQSRQTAVNPRILYLAPAFLDLLAHQGIQRESTRVLLHRRFSSNSLVASAATCILRKNPKGGSITAVQADLDLPCRAERLVRPDPVPQALHQAVRDVL